MSDHANGHTPRILIVDDERANQQLLEIMLAPEGLSVHSVSSGEEALASVAENAPDLILLDVMMPGMDGYQVAARLKSGDASKNIPIIILTALDDRNSRMLGLNTGAEDFLSKPVDRVELCIRVRNLLRLKAYGDFHDRYSQLLEGEVESRTDALQTAEARMRFALTNANVGTWDLDYAAGTVRGSEVLRRQCGLEVGAFDGSFEACIALVHPEEREGVRGQLERAATSHDDFTVAHRLILADGSVRWLSHSGRFQPDAHGRTSRCVGITQDVTEAHALQEQFQHAQKMEVVGRLASGVAHDFNNLLTVILGFAEFVHADTGIGDRHTRDLSEVIKAAKRAAVITKQLLAFGRQQRLHAVPVNLNELVTDMSGMLERVIGADVTIAMTLAPDLGMTFADRGQIGQVIMNLAVNARDAMPDGGQLSIETCNVELEASSLDREPVTAGPYVMVSIADTGTGMTEEVQRRLFEPFFTTKELGKGTGLGLSTTYGIVQQTKGHIRVSSEVGKGTTFRVYLPPMSAVNALPTVLNVATAPLVHPVETLLVVEDEAAIRHLSTRVLQQAGYRVLSASDCDEAEALFERRVGSIDLVVSDVVMPGCGGPELIRRLRARAPALRVLYMSGLSKQTAAHSGGMGRRDAFIQKPFVADELLRQVRVALDDPEPVAVSPEGTAS